MKRFEAIWQVQTSTAATPSASTDFGSVTVTASRGVDWQVTSDLHFFSLDSIVMKDFARPLPLRFFRYLVAFLDYWVTGTAFSIFAKSWRFGLYFLYPFVATALLFGASWFLADVALRALGVMWPGLPLLIALLALWPLLATLGKRWAVLHLMDLWSFSREYLRGRRPEAEALMQRFAAIVAETARTGTFDEIVLVGHSTGGGLILDIMSRGLQVDPDLAGRSPEVSLLTLGSTALKFGLHPAAKAFRQRVQALVDEQRLKWVEVQCMTDVINFFRTDPVKAMKLVPRKAGAQPFPAVKKVRIRSIVDDATYRRIRRRPFRLHYQFIYANSRQRQFYDFYRICFGPIPLSVASRKPKKGADGSLENRTTGGDRL